MASTEACVYEAYANAAVARVLARAGDYDVLHFHVGMHWVPFATLSRTPCIFTIHTFASYDDRWLAQHFPEVALTGISRYQAAQLTKGTDREFPVVYNGCDFGAFDPRYEAGRYLAFLGRMSHDKNPLDAIRIARAAGMPIVLGGGAQQAKEEALFRKGNPAADRREKRAIRRAGKSRAEERTVEERGGAGVPDPMAGTLWVGDDRGDGVRDARAGAGPRER